MGFAHDWPQDVPRADQRVLASQGHVVFALDNQLEVLLGHCHVDVDNTVLAQVRLVSSLQPLVQVQLNEQSAPSIDIRQVGMLSSEEHPCRHEVIGTSL